MTNPANETRRPSTSEAAGSTTGRRDGELQRIVNEAVAVSMMSLAVLTVVDQDRRWVASTRDTVPADQNALDPSLASLVIRPGEILVIGDVLADTRYGHGQFRAPTFRSFVGLPMVDLGGYSIGSLRLADTAPLSKTFNTDALANLAREAERIIAR